MAGQRNENEFIWLYAAVAYRHNVWAFQVDLVAINSIARSRKYRLLGVAIRFVAFTFVAINSKLDIYFYVASCMGNAIRFVAIMRSCN